ncbi:MAG: glycosyltransferase family 2 protein [Cyclobacteriaceae bacterium]|nr:glycosyltransferase family 2 protein [Cyclobacteriaceae bacterium]
MKVGMTLLVRDEADIVRANIEYHLNNGVDFIIITDNGSLDGTYEICQEYLNHGVVEIIKEPPFDFSQYSYVSKMANLLSSKYGASWIINSDADEFFVSRSHNNIKLCLTEVPLEVSVISVSRHDYVPIMAKCDEFLPTDFPYRRAISLALSGRPLPPKVVHRCSPNIAVSQGNHSVSGDILSKVIKGADLEILHFPIRSYQQFESKVKNGGSGYAQNKKLSENTGYHKRYWYDLLMKDELHGEFDRFFYSEEKLENALEQGSLIYDNYLSSFKPFNLTR